MDIKVNFDWRFILALGGAVSFIIASTKLDKTGAEKVSAILADSAKEYSSSDEENG